MADRLGDLADLSAYQDDDPYADAPGVGLGTAPQANVAGSLAAVAGDLGQRVADWYQRQPSWADRMGAAQAGMDPTRLSGGIDPTATLDALGGFMGSTTPRAGLSAVKPMGAIADVSAYQPIKAYHSSPYDFDRFDMSKIGTGEGAQSYGHGLYFAENPAVSGQGGQYWEQFLRGMSGGPEVEAAQMLRNNSFDRPSAVSEAQGLVTHYGDKHSQNILDLLQSGKPVGPRTYEVNINADPSRLLNWDAPLNAQPAGALVPPSLLEQAKREAYNRAVSATQPGRVNELWSMVKDPTQAPGGFLVQAGKYFRGPEISAQLNEAGIPGIKYLDQGSRNAAGWHITPPDQTVSGKWMVKSNDYNSQGMHFDTEAEAKSALNDKIAGQTHNYVMFNDKLIDILRKYGIPGIAGAGTASQAYQGQQEQ